MICNIGKPHPQTDECGTWPCELEDCEDQYVGCTLKRMRTHLKSHAKRICKQCSQQIGANGLAAHRVTCKPAGITRILPTESMEDRLADFVIHAEQIPWGTICVMTRTGDPAFYSKQAALQVIAAAEDITVTIPSKLFPELETAARWRRQDPADTPEPEHTEPQPAPPDVFEQWAAA